MKYLKMQIGQTGNEEKNNCRLDVVDTGEAQRFCVKIKNQLNL